ncbi:hypothetical protein ZPAH1_orf00378 [Aeromonas phage ZPAH1]|nr:hypothetical protein ASwh1_333 [Aeromonas phage Aswh_1]QQG34140.1 hypothetical protein ZPAH1_orf00378 [Aeromonas phage ZPAH1]
MTLLPTNAYVITLNWLRGHSNEVAETYFRTNGIPFERFDCMYYVTEGQYKGYYDVHADPKNRKVMILQDIG